MPTVRVAEGRNKFDRGMHTVFRVNKHTIVQIVKLVVVQPGVRAGDEHLRKLAAVVQVELLQVWLQELFVEYSVHTL